MIVNTYDYTYFSEKNKIDEAAKVLDDKLIFSTYILLKLNCSQNTYTFTIENKDNELKAVNLDINYIFIFKTNIELKNFIDKHITAISDNKQFNNNIKYHVLTGLIILLLSSDYNIEVFFTYNKYDVYSIQNYNYFSKKYKNINRKKINNHQPNFILRFKQILEKFIFVYLFE